MSKSGLFLQEILPFYVSLAVLALAALVGDAALHYRAAARWKAVAAE